MTTRHLSAAAAALTAVALLTACDSPSSSDDTGETGHTSENNAAGTDASGGSVPDYTTATEGPTPEEVRAQQPRIALTYDGGVMVVDGPTDAESSDGEPAVIADIEVPGYLRLSQAGDGRHLFVSTSDGFDALDLGSHSRAHGDHAHHYAGEPRLTGFSVSAEEPGHVVGGPDSAVLWDDGTGDVTTVRLQGMDVVNHFQAPAHHGIAVQLTEDEYLVTTADDDGDRTGAAVVDAEGTEVERSENCPDAHGGAEASDGVFIGCSDGGLLYSGGEFIKVEAPDGYGRIGNQAASPDSRYILGDYKSDEEAAEAGETEHPTQVSVIDSDTGELTLVELDTSYSFRSLAVTDDGTGVVMGTDGSLHLIDLESAEVTRTIPVVDEWTEPEEWQQARPSVSVAGSHAYVTDPANGALIVVDLGSGDEVATVGLPHTPDEVEASAG